MNEAVYEGGGGAVVDMKAPLGFERRALKLLAPNIEKNVPYFCSSVLF